MTNRDERLHREVIGLLPAAGRATRIGPLPCSKELYPIGFHPSDEGYRLVPKVVCHYLLEKMRVAGVTKAYVVLRKGKWDIPTYLRDGTMIDMHIAYLMMGSPFGVPYTLDQAYPFVRDAVVAFGFPDIFFQAEDAFERLLSHESAEDADVILGVFPAEQPEKVDMVDVSNDGRVREIVARPRQTHLCYTWSIAVWEPIFTHFLHQYLAARKTAARGQPELSVGDVIQAAIHHSLRVKAVHVCDEPYIDIGTPEDLVKAVKRLAVQ